MKDASKMKKSPKIKKNPEVKAIFRKILDEALPYYRQGRDGDVEHIRWLFGTLPKYVSQKEAELDILLPVVLLHDVGYSRVPKGANPYNLDVRKFHSVEGAKIAEQILQKIGYPPKKTAEIKRLIIKHDNWAFGDSFENEPMLRIFNNFDFMWMASEKGFELSRKMMGKQPREFYLQLQEFQKKNEEQNRKWFSKRIEGLYLDMMKKRSQKLGI